MIKSHDFASTYVGTPFYMSPEICAAEKYTLKSDIWSLGCIIYELCARDPPFNAKTHFQLVQKIKEGKVAALPDMYSAELNQVIRDCLKVNPDRRPDTVQLLNMPAVKLMRKEKEVVDLNKSLRMKEDALRKREKEVNDRLAGLDRERLAMRDEVEGSLRREWEVKARLEIDRLVNAEIENLRKRFDEEVQAHVDAELKKKTVSFVQPEPQSDGYSSSVGPSDDKSDYPHSSVGATSGDEFPSTSDITDYSIDSPECPKETKKNIISNATRTPFGRAQTMFVGAVGTPMDVEMASPSPIAIASLSLSPRRNGTTKAPSSHTANIFTANANANAGSNDPRWDVPREFTPVDSDDEDLVPSPTRQIKSSKNNPFTSKTRPVLSSQKSCPVNRLKPQTSGTGLVSKVGLAQPDSGSRSPNRRLSKIPSAMCLGQTDAFSTKKENIGSANDALGKAGGNKNNGNIKGRTLVELQQARAGGRPLSAAGVENLNLSPKRGAAFRDRLIGERERRNSGGTEPVAVWDPERDDMPSPFLVRTRRIAKA
jgi:NIMA (never in mitosis gene a)-related kinase